MLAPVSNVLVDGQKILSSGFVLISNGSVLTLEVANLKFEVVAFDDEGADASLELEQSSPSSLRIRLKNFKSPLGIAYGPTPVAKLSGNALFLSVYVSALDKGLKALNYCLALDPEASS